MNKEFVPNGKLHLLEIIVGYFMAIALGYLAFWTIKNTSHETFAVFSIILATTLFVFLIVFRKRPVSFNVKLGLTSGIDIRWCLKEGEIMIEDDLATCTKQAGNPQRGKLKK